MEIQKQIPHVLLKMLWSLGYVLVLKVTLPQLKIVILLNPTEETVIL